jgi:DUF2934 family protein
MARAAKIATKAPRKQSNRGERELQDEQIRVRAYELYMARGGIPGHEVDDWLQAERELQLKR